MLSGLELNIAAKLLNILFPLEASTEEISGDTSSKVFPLMHCMLSKPKALVIDEPLVIGVLLLILKEIT